MFVRNVVTIPINILVKTIVCTLINKFDFFLAVEGSTGCLSGDTIIRYSRGHNARKMSIKKLFEYWYDPKTNKSLPTFIRAYNGKEIRLHKLKDVFYSGKKMVYEMILEDNKSIRATSDHKFLTSNGWKELSQLKVGDTVLCDSPNASKNNRKRIKLRDICLTVDFHPHNKHHKEVEVHRLIYESRINNLSFLEFLDILLNEKEKAMTLKYVDIKKHCIHHKDGCHYNNSIDNLQLMTIEEHLKLHSENNYSNFSQGIPKSIKIKEITKQWIEDVYDIECEDPHHNFSANNIIVHNCGKSTIAIKISKLARQEFSRLKNHDPKTVKYYYEKVYKIQGKSLKEFLLYINTLSEEKRYRFSFKNDIVYSQKSFKKFLASYQRIGIADEMVNITFNRDFQTEDQKNIIKMVNMYRDHNNLIIACIPNFIVLDNQIKNLVKMRISVVRRGIGVIQTPNKTIYGRDKWDTQVNEKIEREWLLKKAKRPAYSRLTTFRGLIRFHKLKEEDELAYQKVKDEKRSIIEKEEMGIKQEESEQPFNKLMDMLFKNAIKNGETLKGFAMANDTTEEALKRKIKKELKDKNMNTNISAYFWDKKAKEIAKKGVFA